MRDTRIPCIIPSETSRLFAVYHLPVEQFLPAPVVVMCHGLGGDKVGRGRFLVLLSELLADHGIASVRFDFQGCGDSEGDFSTITTRRCLTDLQSVIDWVEGQKMFDPSQCSLFGRSFGGLIAILGASQWAHLRAIGVQAAPFHAVALSAGREQGAGPPLQFDASKKVLLFDGEPLTPDFLEQLQTVDMASVLQKISHIPFLHIAGGRDTIIDNSHTDLYRQCRERAEAPSHFVLLPEADHGCSQYRDRQTALKESAEWFISHGRLLHNA